MVTRFPKGIWKVKVERIKVKVSLVFAYFASRVIGHLLTCSVCALVVVSINLLELCFIKKADKLYSILSVTVLIFILTTTYCDLGRLCLF